MDEIVWWKTILYIKLDKLWNKAASKQIKIMIMGSFKRAASVSSRVLRDSEPHYVGPLVGRSVGWLVGPLLGSGPEGADDLCFHT